MRIGFKLLSTLMLLAGLQSVGIAAVTVEQILAYKPKQANIEVSTPTAGELATCSIELEKGKVLPGGKQATAWVVKDAKGNVLRKFHDANGVGGVNMYAYYRDGEEAYREIDSNGNGKIDQYRWLGPNGSKWGVDSDEDGKIDSWMAISPEELSQEILAAVVNKDGKRLDALMISKADLVALGLPAAETARIQAKLAASAAQFQKTCKELARLDDKTIWVHLETKLPQTIAADAMNSTSDLVRYRHATILYQEGDGKNAKHDWLQTGELIQVGKAWRVVQSPTPGMEPVPETGGPEKIVGIPIPSGPEGQALILKLNELDQKGVTKAGPAGIVEFNLARAAIIEQIAAMYTKVEDRNKRDVWLRQVADCYAAAAQQGDKPALARLGEWRIALTKDATSPMLAYFALREISGQYAQELTKIDNKPESLTKLQEGWKAKLTKFVTDFPAAEDTPDAILGLGMVNEFFGSKTEEEAKAAYSSLVKNFPTHALAKRAQGCIDRLTLEGKEFDLMAPTLANGAIFNVNTFKGKAAVVYYWAGWNELAATDFNKIKLGMKDFSGKAELVSVNLDAKAADATTFLAANPVGGTHLYMPGGLENSPLAVRYGITALPVMFLVGPDGKVVSRHVQASTLDEELKKLFKVAEKDK